MYPTPEEDKEYGGEAKITPETTATATYQAMMTPVART